MSDVWKPSVTVAAVTERAGRFCLVEEEADGRVVYNQPASIYSLKAWLGGARPRGTEIVRIPR